MVWGQEGEWIHSSLFARKGASASAAAPSNPAPAAPAPAKEVVTMGTITGNGVNIRSGAGAQFSSVGSLNKGAKVRIWKEENGWCMIDNGKWVAAKYVSKNN